MIVGIIHRENSASSGEGISDVDLPRWNCMVLSRKGLEVRIWNTEERKERWGIFAIGAETMEVEIVTKERNVEG